MRHSSKAVFLGILLCQPCLQLAGRADVTVQDSTQVTGGTLIQPIQQMARFSKTSREMLAPTVSSTYVRGNQKATVSKDYSEIYDLDKETITHINNANRTYTVVTFAELRKQLAELPEKLKQAQQQINQAQNQSAADQPQLPPNLKITYDVQSKSTGATRLLDGIAAQEQVVTLLVKVTDTSAGAAGGSASGSPSGPTTINYMLTTDLWVAPEPPELQQVRDFDLRMGKKIAAGMDMSQWAHAFQRNAMPGGGAGALLAGQPGGVQALAQMAEELAKIKGTRLMEVTSFGGSAEGMAAAPAGGQNIAGNNGSIGGQIATDTATQTAAGESGRLGVFGNALSSSALSAFHRKKAQPAPTPEPTPAAASGAQPTGNTMVLMEMTTRHDYSEASAPESAFQIPPGYKKVSPQA